MRAKLEEELDLNVIAQSISKKGHIYITKAIAPDTTTKTMTQDILKCLNSNTALT